MISDEQFDLNFKKASQWSDDLVDAFNTIIKATPEHERKKLNLGTTIGLTISIISTETIINLTKDMGKDATQDTFNLMVKTTAELLDKYYQPEKE